MIFFFLAPQVFAVVIDEVYYNPINSENGGEFVLLFNEKSYPVDISGWYLKTRSSEMDATLPPNTLILPGGYLLIADSGFSLDKDSVSWPDADYEEAISLPNTDGGVALMNGTNLIDVVGWGNSEDPFFEGTPAISVDSGESLRRNNHQDTDDNSNDFVRSTPLLNLLNIGEDLTIKVKVEVKNDNPQIVNTSISDESKDDGIQIKPLAGEEKSFSVSMLVFDPKGEMLNAKAVLNNKEFSFESTRINDTHFIYQTNVTLDYDDKSGFYDVEFFLGNETKKESLFYEELLALKTEPEIFISAKVNSVSFGSVEIRNVGNVNADLSIASSKLYGKENSSNIFVSTDDKEFQLGLDFEDLFSLKAGEKKSLRIVVNADNLNTGLYEGLVKISASSSN